MTWEEYQRTARDLDNNGREKTTIWCPRCGKKYIYRLTDIVLTTYPPKYRYECDCGWSGTGI